MTETERPVGIDLFCGAGGMSLGFEQAGFEVVAAVDADPTHVATHKRNFSNCRTIEADLFDLSGQELRSRADLGEKQIDVVFGGPPCGGFSVMGRRNPDDRRNQLLGRFAALVQGLAPRYFVVENVEGLLVEPMTRYLEDFKESVGAAGFVIVRPIKVLDASDFGVPQRRRRIFILGYQEGLVAPEYPAGDCEDNGRPTIWDAIGDLARIGGCEESPDADACRDQLPSVNSRYAKILRGEVKDPDDLSLPRNSRGRKLTGCARVDHTEEVIRRFESTQPGSRERISKFYRLTKEGIAPTLRAGTGKSHGSYSAARPIHPVEPRCITVREGARLHSFPDWFEFHPTKWHGFRQVGNSVPPLLARAVAQCILQALRQDRQLQG